MQRNDLVLLRVIQVLLPYIPLSHMDNVPQNDSMALDRSVMSAHLSGSFSLFSHARSESELLKAVPVNTDGLYF